jgi:hypothetical protein
VRCPVPEARHAAGDRSVVGRDAEPAAGSETLVWASRRGFDEESGFL